MENLRVVVVGDLLYDLLARVDGDVRLGIDTFTPIHAAGGGSGANAAAWLAASGVETHFVGRVGDDVFGRFLEEELQRAGVRTHLARDPSLATGKVFVLVDGAGERTMITDRGAVENLGPEDIPISLFRGGHLHLVGYTFSGGSRRETAFEALRLAREAGMTVSVDPSAVPSQPPEKYTARVMRARAADTGMSKTLRAKRCQGKNHTDHTSTPPAKTTLSRASVFSSGSSNHPPWINNSMAMAPTT